MQMKLQMINSLMTSLMMKTNRVLRYSFILYSYNIVVNYMNISINELKKIYKNINIIDIRSKNKYLSNHISNSRNIDKNELILYPCKYLNKTEKYYIYCQNGISSLRVYQILKNMGSNVYNIIGGYEEWLKQ